LAPFGLGIGLSTGQVAAALLSSRERVEYTMAGDTVNLAAYRWPRLSQGDVSRDSGEPAIAETPSALGRQGP
jgi:adenylate cyclase